MSAPRGGADRRARSGASWRLRTLALATVVYALASWTLRDQPIGWIGVTLGSDAAPAPADAAGAAHVATVLPESPAEAAGIRAGDHIRSAGGRRVGAGRDLVAIVRRTPPGAMLALTVERDGSVATRPVQVAARPPDFARRLEADRDGWQEPERVLDLLAVASGSAVADVGAGGGYFTERLAERVGRAGRVIAIDVDPDAVRQLRTRFPARRFPAVAVHAGTAADPGLGTGTIDAALLVDVYHELRDAPAMLMALRRALRPGGRLVVVDRPAAEYDPAQHAIPEARVVGEAETAGFRLRERADLTRQFALVLE